MSTGITGKGVKKNSYIPKDLMPGLVEARIVGLAVVKKEKILNKEGYPEFEVQIKLEGHPPADKEFVGWQKDSQDPSKGNYKGPFKLIKSSNWPIKMFKYTSKKPSDNGKEITVTAESQILNLLQEIAEAYGKPNLFDEPQYQKEFPSWSDYIKQMNHDLQLNKTYVAWCLGGQKTRDTKGYVKYYLCLPEKKTCQNKPRIASKLSDLCEYDEATMINVHKNFHSTPAANTENAEQIDEDFDTTAVDTDADYGNTDMGTDDTLFEGADDFDTTDIDEDAF